MSEAIPPSFSTHTFLWHDYETFGANPRRDRPAQFAAVRTDADLNEIGEPIMCYCQPAPDFVPDPEACLITGITPQQCLANGVPEREFATLIEAALAQPGTIGVGYNTIRFDDEVTRFMFWRNLIDPYAREWQNQCGRWDLLDVVRTAYALRPEGIVWPLNEEGHASFKLTDLTTANQLVHEAAHDALSDVRATIALARLIKEKQSRLFDFCLGLHKKDRVAQELGLPTHQSHAKPFLHISGMFPSQRGCLAVMWPLAMHPTNKNELIAWDLSHDPRQLSLTGVEELRTRLFTKTSELPESMMRLPIKTLHLNKSPIVIAHLKTLTEAQAKRWGIDMAQCWHHAQAARELPDMSAIWPEVFARPNSAETEVVDVDHDLYGGFVGNNDRRKLNQLRSLNSEQLAMARANFEDPRLEEIVFRYRARNFPASLDPAQTQRWQAHCSARLLEGQGGALTIHTLFYRINALSEHTDERGEAILSALYDYAASIAPENA